MARRLYYIKGTADQASLCAPINTGTPIIGDHRDDEYERDDDAIVYSAIIYTIAVMAL